LRPILFGFVAVFLRYKLACAIDQCRDPRLGIEKAKSFTYPTSHQPTNLAPRQARNHMRPRPSMQDPPIRTSLTELSRNDRILQRRRRRESNPIQHEPRTDRRLFLPQHQLPRLGPNTVSGHHQIRRERAAVAQDDSAELLALRLEKLGHGRVEFHGDAEFERVLVEELVEFGSVDCQGGVGRVADGEGADEGSVEFLHGAVGGCCLLARSGHEAGPFVGGLEAGGCDDYHFAWRTLG
jgi:hypothetical protein